jgi:long-chain fatty acid transport protein
MRTYGLIGLGLLAFWPAQARALGIRIADQDAEATARGNAFVATADNPSAVYYNPAGITQLKGLQARLGVYAVAPGAHYRSGAGPESDTKDRWEAAPQLYATWTPKEHWLSVGLGMYTPYGLSLKWPEPTGFETLAIKGRITYITVNPVVAVQPHPRLSVAAGPTINLSDTELLQRKAAFLGGNLLEFKGDGTDYGFNAGVRWQVHERHVLGATYRSATGIRYDGTVTGFLTPFASGANARLGFPQHVAVGWSFRPTEKWNLEFNADWTDWDRVDTVTLNDRSGASAALPFRWQSSWFYEWGVTRQLPRGFFVSGGYIFSENSVPDRGFNPLVPDSDRHVFSLGVGRRAGAWSWALSYQAAYGPARTVTGSPTPTFTLPGGAPVPLSIQTANGRYDSLSHALALSVGYSF